jgi:hypothetical protein
MSYAGKSAKRLFRAKRPAYPSNFRKTHTRGMDCRVKPGNDEPLA